MIKIIICIICFVAHSLYGQGNQPVAIGNWRVHLNYQDAGQIAEVGRKIYCATTNGMFAYDGDGGTNERLSPINGFYGYNVDVLNYSENLNTLIIAYSDGTVELLNNNTTTINEDIKRKTITGSKKINHINSIGNIAWFSTAFGLLEFNIEKNEFKNSYLNIGPNGTQIQIFSSAILHDSIFISTKLGVMKGSLASNVNLSDYNNWTTSKSASVKSTFIASFNDRLCAELDSQLYQYDKGRWSLYEPDSLLTITNISVLHNKMIIGVYGKYMITEDNNGNKTYPSVNILNQCLIDVNNHYWYASPNQGLVFQQSGGEVNYYPNGPRSTDNFNFINAYDQLYCSAGAFSRTTYAPSFNANKYYAFDNFNWQSSAPNELIDTLFDFTYMAFSKTNSKLFIGTHTKGLVQLNNGVPTMLYNQGNSPLKRRAGIFCIISGLAMDKNNNLWVSNYDVDSSFLQLSSAGKWTSYKLPIKQTGEITIDNKNNKWVITPRSGSNVGIVYFNDKGTPSKTDDIASTLSTNKGNGNLPSATITALAFTKNGELLVGSDQGYGKIRSPNNILTTGGNYDFERIIVSVEAGTNLGGYLLGSEYINCITMDGADRRWVGTNNGAWLIDNDGETIIQHFTIDNTPLLSNNINSIGIVESTGEIFFGTDKGIVSFRGDATNESKDFSDIKIFPNPVRPDFDGELAVTGLIDNSLVKITDINGRLIFQTYSNGGMATWNCKTFDGTRPSTGVYLVFCINPDGSEKGVGKILFIK